MRPNADYLWENAVAFATEATALAESAQASDSHVTLCLDSVGVWEAGEYMDLERIRQIDPYDLTGAQRHYIENTEHGFSPEELQLAAERTLQRYAPSTLRALTGKLRDYLAFCADRHLVPVPADRTTVTRYLSHLTLEAQAKRGQALQASTLDQFRDAIRQAHEIAGYENPWTRWPVLASELKGYRRLYARPVIQAHAIRLDELASLVGAAHASAGLSPRDSAILTVVADPEVGLSLRNAAALTWENVTLYDADDPRPAELALGNRLYSVPNRAADPMAVDALVPAGEMPVSVRLCGTTALRTLAAQLVAQGKPVSGPVFRKDDGNRMSYNGVAKVIREAAKSAMLSKGTSYSTDDRLLLLDAVGQPAAIGLRDAAIMNLMWWASLRRSEVGPLTVGDLGTDERARGLVLLIRKSKTDVNGQWIPIPWDRGMDGSPRPTDAWLAIQQWFSAYESLIGRKLNEDDPLFINIHRDRGTAISDKAVGEIVQRYAGDAGVVAELGERISSHGFRAGYATEALTRGMSSESVAKVQRRSDTGSLLGYNRPSDPYENLLTFTLRTSEDAWERYEAAKVNAQFHQSG